MSFIQYLNDLRAYYAGEELLHTQKSVTQIALDNGFHDIPVFNKVFKKTFGVSPTAYRKGRTEQEGQPSVSSKEMESIQKDYIRGAEQRLSDSQNIIRRRAVLNCRKHRPFHKIWNQAVSVGGAYDLLSAGQQKQICFLRDEIGFQYIRLPHLFSHKMQLRESGNTEFVNMDHIDTILDFIVKNHLKPLIVIGDRPSYPLQPGGKAPDAKAEEPFFRDLDDFQFIVETVLQHIMVRYGAERVIGWIWEIQYNPASNTPEEYFEQFRIAASFIRRWIPKAKIGGCGHLLGEAAGSFLSEWTHQKFQPDFLSVSAYPYERTESRKNHIHFTRAMEPSFFVNETRKLKEEMTESGMAGLPIYFTECNLSWCNSNPVNDTCAKAARFLKVMSDLLEEIEMGIYDLASDLSVHHRMTNLPLFGGKGLLTRDNIPKPVFYTLSNMKFTGNELIKHGENYIFTLHGENLLCGICYNAKAFNINYYSKPEQEIMQEDLEIIYSNSDELDLQFLISGLQDGLYCIKQGIFNEKNSVLHKWIHMGNVDIMDINDLEYLRQAVQTDIFIRQEKVSGGTLHFSIKLPAHVFSLVNIYPIRLDG